MATIEEVHTAKSAVEQAGKDGKIGATRLFCDDVRDNDGTLVPFCVLGHILWAVAAKRGDNPIAVMLDCFYRKYPVDPAFGEAHVRRYEQERAARYETARQLYDVTPKEYRSMDDAQRDALDEKLYEIEFLASNTTVACEIGNYIDFGDEIAEQLFTQNDRASDSKTRGEIALDTLRGWIRSVMPATG